jgi:hypothetical protein
MSIAQQRKERNEKVLEGKGIKVNSHLPLVEAEEEITLRTANEIATRVSVLAVINFVAFSSVSPEEATNYLQRYNLWEYVTPKEKAFLLNATDKLKNRESWKCEGIWVLMWALKVVDTLPFANELCSLNAIDPENYPIGQKKDPNFIRRYTEIRSKSEILDMTDLHYRMNWACVDARLNGKEMNEIHPGVVYERHYALNWLVNYAGQEWDEITCDT